MNDDIVHGDGVKGRNSNIMGKHQFKCRGVECDLVDDVGVFLAKGHAVACDLEEIVLDDHVGLCILYCLVVMSIMMTIWKWLLA